jgi:hypothetical protein
VLYFALLSEHFRKVKIKQMDVSNYVFIEIDYKNTK